MCFRVFVSVRQFKYREDPRGKVGEKQGELKAKEKRLPEKVGRKVRGKLGMCLYNVTGFVEFPCSVIQVGSMLSSQRLNKVMAEVSPVICKRVRVGSCKKWFQWWGGVNLNKRVRWPDVHRNISQGHTKNGKLKKIQNSNSLFCFSKIQKFRYVVSCLTLDRILL